MRRSALASLIVLALALAVPGFVSAPSGTAATIKFSASLTQTRLTSSQVGSVKVVYTFSTRSKSFAYLLSIKHGSAWQTVNSVRKTGSFTGSKSMTLKTVFGASAAKVGGYRLKLTATSGSRLLAFTVVKATSTTTSTAGSIKPKAGYWVSTNLSGPYGGPSFTTTNISFNVESDQSNVGEFRLSFDYSGVYDPITHTGCSGSGDSVLNRTAPITKGQFSTPSPTGAWSGGSSQASGSVTLNGTFDSSTSAHGTGVAYVGLQCQYTSGGYSGTFSWTASWQSS